MRSIGAYLARQRRLRGLSLAELADVTRIPQRSLERLEAGAFDGQTDGFARGFVRTVAQALGLDPEDTVARMLEEPRSGTAGSRKGWIPPVPAKLAMALLALLVAGLGALALSSIALPPLDGPAAGDDLVYRRDPVRELAAQADRSSRFSREPGGGDPEEEGAALSSP